MSILGSKDGRPSSLTFLGWNPNWWRSILSTKASMNRTAFSASIPSESGTDLLYIQELLGQKPNKSKIIYSLLIIKNFKKIKVYLMIYKI